MQCGGCLNEGELLVDAMMRIDDRFIAVQQWKSCDKTMSNVAALFNNHLPRTHIVHDPGTFGRH